MDGSIPFISAPDLFARLGTEAAPIVLDVRRAAAYSAAERQIVGAVHQSAELIDPKKFRPGRAVVAYCVHGHEVSQGVAATLRAASIDAAYLQGGIAAWIDEGFPTRRKIGALSPSKWVTRERPKIDRIACPWLIARFIDPQAEFIYVPPGDVLAVAQRTGATPYDIDSVEFTHEGERCSFDTLLRIYDIADRAFDHLATIVRGADTSRHDLAPQCGGLFAISLGLSKNYADDHEMLKHGMIMYDALYVWCRSLQTETHNWPPKSAPPLPEMRADPTNF